MAEIHENQSKTLMDSSTNSKEVTPTSSVTSSNDDGSVRDQFQGDKELVSKMIRIQSKLFYLDVKQNKKGSYLKISEIDLVGRRSQIFLALSLLEEFKGHLTDFNNFYASLGPPNTDDDIPETGNLKSVMMMNDNRRYHIDLKQNPRGRFLRVSQNSRGRIPRTWIAVPAQGIVDIRDALVDILQGVVSVADSKSFLPEARQMRVENKNFYFDIAENSRGVYMRISQVSYNYRTAITVPEHSWATFRDILADYCKKRGDIDKADSVKSVTAEKNSDLVGTENYSK